MSPFSTKLCLGEYGLSLTPINNFGGFAITLEFNNLDTHFIFHNLSRKQSPKKEKAYYIIPLPLTKKIS